jgi:glycerate kinase
VGYPTLLKFNWGCGFMKILIASDSFKESLSSLEVAEQIKKAFLLVDDTHNITTLPIGDGGEGTVSALVSASNGHLEQCNVIGPLGEKISSYYGISGDNKTAFIEMAAASGLELIKENERNPLKSSTYGTGQLIKNALDKGIRDFIIGLGGSATNDGGAGMARALGVVFLDKDGNELDGSGGSLIEIETIDLKGLDQRLSEVSINIASDVDNVLLGEDGATMFFGAQKGATKEIQILLEEGMLHYSNKLAEQLEKSVSNIPGAGAAGGLGAGLLAFTSAKFKSGIDTVLDYIQFDKYLDSVDLVITGEGKIDAQTVHGKAPIGVTKRAIKQNVKVIAFCGIKGDGYEEVYKHGISEVYQIALPHQSIHESIKKGNENLYIKAIEVAKKLEG